MPRLACLVALAACATASAADWETDLAKAKARAAREKKPIFVVFRCEH